MRWNRCGVVHTAHGTPGMEHKGSTRFQEFPRQSELALQFLGSLPALESRSRVARTGWRGWTADEGPCLNPKAAKRRRML